MSLCEAPTSQLSARITTRQRLTALLEAVLVAEVRALNAQPIG